MRFRSHHHTGATGDDEGFLGQGLRLRIESRQASAWIGKPARSKVTQVPGTGAPALVTERHGWLGQGPRFRIERDESADDLTAICKTRLEGPDPSGKVPDRKQRIPERVAVSTKAPSGFSLLLAPRGEFDKRHSVCCLWSAQQTTDGGPGYLERPNIEFGVAVD
jgi:hypothetical protein